MAAQKTPEQKTSELDPSKDRYAGSIDDPVPAPDDPGGAHAKGYSADPTPTPTGREGQRYNVAPDSERPGRPSRR